MGFGFFTQELAIDLGTANTIIFQNDQIVLDEPSIIAIDTSTSLWERNIPRIGSCPFYG